MTTRHLLAAAVLAASATASASAAAAAPAGADDARAGRGTMTQAEYRKVEKGMSLDRVRKIAGARGNSNSGYRDCLAVQFHGSTDIPGDYRYSVLFERSHGVFRVKAKSDDSSFYLCPTPL